MVIQSIYSERCLTIFRNNITIMKFKFVIFFSCRISSKILIRILFVDVREILKF